MKTQNRQPEYSTLETKKKIRKYNRIKNGLFAVGIAGTIVGLGSPSLVKGYEEPEISKTYKNVQATMKELQNGKKNLGSKLSDFAYTTSKIEEARRVFNEEYDKKIFTLNKAIEETKLKASEIESNSEFKQYQKNKKTKRTLPLCLYSIGFMTMIGGMIGSVKFDKKKENLERKLKLNN